MWGVTWEKGVQSRVDPLFEIAGRFSASGSQFLMAREHNDPPGRLIAKLEGYQVGQSCCFVFLPLLCKGSLRSRTGRSFVAVKRALKQILV